MARIFSPVRRLPGGAVGAIVASAMRGKGPLPALLPWLLLGALPVQGGDQAIAEFGAVGDGRTLNTAAIQRAIDRCGDEGGGRVTVPPGVFVTGTLQLRSRVELHLARGAVLRGSTDLADYAPNGRRVGLLYTENAEDVAVTGPGDLDGSGDAFMDLAAAKHLPPAATPHTRQGDHFREVAAGLGDGPVVPRDRPFQMIIFANCRNVTVRDARITNAPFWTLHFADCDGVIASGLRIWNNVMVPNSDGIDCTSCSNVLIADCDIRTGDDALVFGGYAHHFDLPGFHDLRRDSENVVVTNCTLLSRSSAIRIGGADQNAMRRYTFSNLVIHDSNRGVGIFLREEGSIEDMTFTNLVIDTRLHTGDWWGQGEPIHISAVRNRERGPIGRIRNVKFAHVVATGEAGIVVFGTPESVIEGVSFEDVTFRLRASPLAAAAGGNFDLRPVIDPRLQLFSHDIPALDAEYVRNLRIRDLTVAWDGVREPYFTNGITVTHFAGVRIDGYRGGPAPANPRAAAIALRDGRGFEITNPRPADAPAHWLELERATAE